MATTTAATPPRALAPAHLHPLEVADPEVAGIVEGEARRQRETVQLIPSENYPSAAIREATGSVLTLKYAEGYPKRRYYQGCEWVDAAEDLARRRARRLYKAEYANVQPHSGSQANIAAYFALLQPGDTVLAMRLDQGGHLTHGRPGNISAQLYNFVHYGVHPDTEYIDYDEVERLAREHAPRMIVCGATAYPRIIDFARFREIADAVGAHLVADMAHIAGLVAGGVHPSPVPHAHIVTSSTHKTLRGPRGGFILCREEFRKPVNSAVIPGTQGGPLEHVIAAKAVMFHEAAQPEFREYARRVVENAKALADTLLEEGFQLVSGGTDNHLLLIRLPEDGPTGREVAEALEQAGIIVNANTVPGDTRSAWVTSGIRLGSPAATTFGFGAEELREIARLIARVIRNLDDGRLRLQAAEQVRELCRSVEARRHHEQGN